MINDASRPPNQQVPLRPARRVRMAAGRGDAAGGGGRVGDSGARADVDGVSAVPVAAHHPGAAGAAPWWGLM